MASKVIIIEKESDTFWQRAPFPGNDVIRVYQGWKKLAQMDTKDVWMVLRADAVKLAGQPDGVVRVFKVDDLEDLVAYAYKDDINVTHDGLLIKAQGFQDYPYFSGIITDDIELYPFKIPQPAM
jgi:hypothetical protein